MIDVFFETISEAFNWELSIFLIGSGFDWRAELLIESLLLAESVRISLGAVNFKIGLNKTIKFYKSKSL